MGHPAGALGVVHPFPTLLASLATMTLALIAGGDLTAALMLGGAMLGFQASIGATNDLADRTPDAARGARKPIPAGQVSVRTACLVAVAGAVAGLALSALMGPGTLLLGAAGLACGIAYDLWLRPRGLSAIAYALALPLLVLYAWWGAAGTWPPGGPVLILLAALVGPGLYLSNALVDAELDAIDGSGDLAARLGPRRGVLALGAVVALVHVLAWLLWAGTTRPLGPALVMIIGGGLAVGGVMLSTGQARGTRSMGWTSQALATALLGVALLAALVNGGAPGGVAPGG